LNLTGHTHSPVGIIGHSFGGRCALQYVHTLKNNYHEHNHNILPPKCTWLLDTVPGKAHGSVSNVIQALQNINIANMKTKQDLVHVLTKEQNIDKSIANWMTTNVRKNKQNEFEFMFDINTVIGVLDDFPKQNFMEMIDDCSATTLNNDKSSSVSLNSKTDDNDKDDMIYLVMAGKNKAWTNDIVSNFQNIEQKQQLEIVSLPKAGHWVHVDDLDGLMDAMDKCFFNLHQ
jgi:esterase